MRRNLEKGEYSLVQKEERRATGRRIKNPAGHVDAGELRRGEGRRGPSWSLKNELGGGLDENEPQPPSEKMGKELINQECIGEGVGWGNHVQGRNRQQASMKAMDEPNSEGDRERTSSRTDYRGKYLAERNVCDLLKPKDLLGWRNE